MQSPSAARTLSSVGSRPEARRLAEQLAASRGRGRVPEPLGAGAARAAARGGDARSARRPLRRARRATRARTRATRATRRVARRPSPHSERRGARARRTPARAASASLGRARGASAPCRARAACPCPPRSCRGGSCRSSPSPRTRSRDRSRRRDTRRRSGGSRTSRTCRRATRSSRSSSSARRRDRRRDRGRTRSRRARGPACADAAARRAGSRPSRPKPVVWHFRQLASPALCLASSDASARACGPAAQVSYSLAWQLWHASEPTWRAAVGQQIGSDRAALLQDLLPLRARQREDVRVGRVRDLRQEGGVLEPERVLRVVAAEAGLLVVAIRHGRRARGADRRGRGTSRSRRSRARAPSSSRSKPPGLPEAHDVAAHALAVGVGAVLHERAERVRVIGELPGLVLRLVADAARLAARVALRAQQHRNGRARELGHAHAQQRTVGLARASPACDGRSGPRGRSSPGRARPRTSRTTVWILLAVVEDHREEVQAVVAQRACAPRRCGRSARARRGAAACPRASRRAPSSGTRAPRDSAGRCAGRTAAAPACRASTARSKRSLDRGPSAVNVRRDRTVAGNRFRHVRGRRSALRICDSIGVDRVGTGRRELPIAPDQVALRVDAEQRGGCVEAEALRDAARRCRRSRESRGRAPPR